MKNFLKQPYNWILIGLAAINVTPLLAPILLKLSESAPIFTLPANVIYFVYSFTCHQLHYRSLHVFDYQWAWCSRDVGIWLGILTAAIIVKRFKLKALPWYWVIPFIIPIALDGGIQTIATLVEVQLTGASGDPVYISTNLLRFLTGSLFGLGLGLWALGTIWEQTRGKVINLKPIQWPIVLKTMTAFTIVYICLVGVWSLTSTTYKPAGLLDNIVRTPASNFYDRRVNGPCPTEGTDLIEIACFFE